MDERQELIASFEAAMQGVYDDARTVAGYNATRFLQMLHAHGGVETAHRLLANDDVGYGFTELWLSGHADVTVEYLVLTGGFGALFDDDELRRARDRLGKQAPPSS